MQEEYSSYFDALRQHPRLLVGTEVPSLSPDAEEGTMETIRDAEDAKDWQDAVKHLLTEEVRERAQQSMDENKGILDTVHSSIELFTSNPDLVPGTRQFNRQLADRFAAMAKPYELRVDGKLHGYTIPVQPLIDQLRTQVAKQPVAPAADGARRGRPPGSKNKPKEEQPQAGIRSKAGSESGEAEDFSTLFGTLGLPNIRI